MSEQRHVPEGWAATSIRDVCRLVNGRAFKPSEWSREGLPIIRIQNLNNPGSNFNRYAGEVDPKHLVRPRELLFAWSGTPGTSFGTHIWEGGRAVLNQHIFRVLFPEEFVSKEFLRLAINERLDELIHEAHGGAGLAHVTKPVFEATEILLAPLVEQRRIATTIEQLLTRLNRAQGHVDKVTAILKRFRQSVLAAACSGRLTEKWRDEHTSDTTPTDETLESVQPPDSIAFVDIPEEWQWVGAGYGYADATYGTSMRCDSNGLGIPVLRVPNIASGQLDLGPMKYAPASDELRRLILEDGDILVCRTNGSLELIGKAAVVQGLPRPHAFASYLIRLRTDPDVFVPEYFHLVLLSPIGRAQIQDRARTSAGQFNLNLEILRSLATPRPSVEEQREIVRRVGELLRFASSVEKRVSVTSAGAEKLTQSILAKTFRGELVPTEAELAAREGREYEPAAELLERIRKQHKVQPSQPRGQRKVSTTTSTKRSHVGR